MNVRLWLLAASLVLPHAYAEVVTKGCDACFETSTRADCADCADHVRHVMMSAGQDQLTQLMQSIRERSHDQCQGASLDSRACQIYLSLCEDKGSCDNDLFRRLLEHRDQNMLPKRQIV
ncbi:MAG TPA: hypothetical protein DCW33_04035 [Proteobacteria bacterium]|nr:hypothetical protein [Pseudomonadota bacterium]|tara:strand:+ start:517 stop:873 length:357 start_codon:yes stop_codon:yes gene_type:complete